MVGYPTFIADGDPVRLRAAYAPDVLARRQAIRAAWDPTTCCRT